MVNVMLPFMLVIIPVSMAYFLTPAYIKLQQSRNITEKNFQGKRVATAGGVILLLILLGVQPFYFLYPGRDIFVRLLMLFYLIGITMLGLVDDFWGDKKCKGFRGHIKILWQKKVISTGLYKAAGGFLLGISVSTLAGGGGWELWFLKGTFLALFSNLFNLLDTRPARAAKAYLLFSLVVMLLYRESLLTIFPLWSALYIYLFWELNTQIMLGDTGAYLLGGAIGFPLVSRLTPGWLISLNLVLLLLHCYCEKFSLNKFIESKKLFHLGGPERGK